MDENIVRNYQEAVHEISKAYYFINSSQYENSVKQYPYFFIVGAGVSADSIKTSSQIIAECKKICRENSPAAYEDMEQQYAYWLAKAFPHKETRKRYLENLSKGKKIPESVIKLANILMSRKVSNLVVTPDFDTFLFETLKLLGENDIILADTSNSAGKLDIESSNLNILHVYGTYEFYDLCSNVNRDIYMFSVKSFLRTALNSMSPIVIGYNGWENDVIMTELKERFQMPLKYKMYWFCHTEEDYAGLPSWLKYIDEDKKIKRDDVVFVLPKQTSIYSADEVNFKNFDLNDRLDAKDVLSSFISEFDVKSPEIIQNPINFLKKYFERSFSDTVYSKYLLLKFDNTTEKNDINGLREGIINNNIKDIISRTDKILNSIKSYSISEIRGILHYLALIIEEYTVMGIGNNELRMLVNYYKKIYENIKDAAKNDDKLKFVKVQLKEVRLVENELVFRNKVENILALVEEITDDGKDYHEVYRECISLKLSFRKIDNIESFDKIENKIKFWNGIEDIKLLIRIYIEKAMYYQKNNMNEEAVKMYNTAERNFPKIRDDEWLENIFILTKLKKASLYNSLQQYEKALYEIETVKTRFINVKDKKIEKLLIDALILKGNIFFKNGKLDQAEEALSEIYDRYGQDKDLEVRRKAVKSIMNKAEVLEKGENYYEAIEVYNDIINKYKNDSDEELQAAAAQSRLNKIVILTKSERDDKIIKKCNEFLDIYENEKYKNNEKIKLIIMQVKLCKAIGLHNSGRQKDAMSLYNEIIAIRKNDADVKMMSLIMEAKIFKSYCLKEEPEEINPAEMCNELLSLCRPSADDEDGSNVKVAETIIKQADFLINSDEGTELNSKYESSKLKRNNEDVKGTIRELIQEVMKSDPEAAESIYNQLREGKLTSGKEDNEDEMSLSELNSLVNSENPDFEVITEKALHLSEKSEELKEAVKKVIGPSGAEAYADRNFEKAEGCYAVLGKIDQSMGLNLAYMIRRGEVKDASVYPNFETLVDRAANAGNNRAYINKALLLTERGDFRQAVFWIRKITSKNAFDWWKRMDNSEVEKFKVLFMGAAVNLIDENEYNINDLIEKLEEFHENDFILNVERIIYMEG